MPEMTKDQLREDLRNRNFKPVYVLYGQETFLRDATAKTFSKYAFTEGEMRDFNETAVSLNSPEELLTALAAANQLPMMASLRLVIITDVNIAATANRDTLKEDLEPELQAYLKDPSPQTILLFVAGDLNGNRKLTKLLKANAAVVHFDKLKNNELREWAKRTVRESGGQIDDRSLSYLMSKSSGDLRSLSNEINKLVTASLPEGMIDMGLIESLSVDSSELSNFELTDNLVAGRKKEALASLKKILDDGAEPLALLGLISYNLRHLLIAKALMESGADRKEVEKAAKLRYPNQEPFLAAARRADKNKLIKNLQKLAETDLSIKTSHGGGGKKGSRSLIELLVCELV